MFFERLELMCKTNNCKPNTIAAHLGLSNATATKWKKGAIPNGETLIGIADYLDCSVDYLLGRTDNPESHKIPLTSEPGSALSIARAGAASDQQDSEAIG